MKIVCPECESKLSLGTPKPGRYKPKCKHCHKPFFVQITDGDPPKVAVGKIRAKADQPKADQPSRKKTTDPARTKKPTQTRESAKTVSDVQATLDQPTPTIAMEDTIDPSVDSVATQGVGTGQTRGATVDATIDHSAAESVGASAATSAAPAVRSGTSAKLSEVVDSESVAKQNSVQESSASRDLTPPPDRLGGYKILRELGRGAMGAVYAAKQISLDRLVALKTIRGRLANNPASLARFTREAYAAAQLTHHNVVQIYDFGEDDGKHFFSMEWVRGGPLSDVIRDRGPLEPKLAVGYTLQAARGLQFAHRHGMVHRDVKPANLLLSDEGVVKVADLGLVKIPDLGEPDEDDFQPGTVSASGMSGTEVTMQGTAVGTPAYMAPEQGIDAANVDHRADIYSLGCSLFYLLAGRAPFDSSVVSEVMEQHAKQQVPDLTNFNKRIPRKLQSIVERSMSKRPQDRFGSLSEMIHAMESFLGIESEGQFSPTSQQADAWEPIAAKFTKSAPLLKLSTPLLFGFIGACTLLTAITPLAGINWLLLGPTTLATGLFVAIAMGAVGGKSAVATSFRRWISSLSWFDKVVAGFGAIILLLVVLLVGLWLGALAGIALGAIAGVAYHFAVVVTSQKSQSEPLADAEKFVRNLRIEGADEEGIRGFVARYSGKHWQQIYENLFGYDSMAKQREELRSEPGVSASALSIGIRDKVYQTFKSKADANLQARDQKHLAKIEEKGLASEGVSPDEARERAWQMAMAVIENAKLEHGGGADMDAKVAAEAKRQKMKDMLADARSGKYAKKRDPLATAKFALGGHTRLLLGCLLLAVFAIWAQSSGFLETVKQLAAQENINAQDVGANLGGANANTARTMLGTEGLPTGVAGLLLAMSSFISGWRMSPFALVATIVILFGSIMGIPSMGIVQAWMVASVIGIIIYIPGVIWGESPITE